MRLIEISSAETWDAFQASRPYAQFPQSWAWGEFRISQGCPVRRFALEAADKTWSAAIQMEYRKRRFGMGYWFAPRGPVFASEMSDDAVRDAMFELCEQLLKIPELRIRTLFWRFEPTAELGKPEGLVPLSFQRTHALNPASTILLDLNPTESELLSRMHEKTRYNIRLADRRGVTVRTGRDPKDVDAFLRLMDETATRDRFVQHPSAYLKHTFEFLSSRGMANIRLAEQGGRVLAANLEISFGDTVTYLYGASASEARNLMAPFALHWAAIRDAKKRGFSLYDFWGANPLIRGSFYYKPSWEGITRFKQGWGGRQADFVGTWDLTFHPITYRLIHLDQFFRG